MSDFWSDPSSTSVLYVCECAGSPEPSVVAYVISTIISWAGCFLVFLANLASWPELKGPTIIDLLDHAFRYCKCYSYCLTPFYSLGTFYFD